MPGIRNRERNIERTNGCSPSRACAAGRSAGFAPHAQAPEQGGTADMAESLQGTWKV